MTERIVAVGLLTKRELSVLGPAFDRAWPVEEAPSFNELLRAIDEADPLARGAHGMHELRGVLLEVRPRDPDRHRAV